MTAARWVGIAPNRAMGVVLAAMEGNATCGRQLDAQ